jgi:hypothetical protein
MEEERYLLLYNRRTAVLAKLQGTFFPAFAANGMLGHGVRGFERLADLTSLQYYAVLPGGPVASNWSPDFKFASAGYTPGRGTGC